MRLPAGTHTFGPENGALWVKTRRTGAAAAAGHDLVILVTGWTATLEVGADPAETTAIALDVDATSLRVREGVGGMQELGDDDKESIRQTIDDEVLKGSEIRFRSTAVEPLADGDRLWVEGDLTLAGAVRPLAFDVELGDDGRLTGTAVVKQSDWGMTPYSTLYGALKVVDEIEVAVSVSLGAGAPGDADVSEPSIPWDLSWHPGRSSTRASRAGSGRSCSSSTSGSEGRRSGSQSPSRSFSRYSRPARSSSSSGVRASVERISPGRPSARRGRPRLPVGARQSRGRRARRPRSS